MRPDPTRAGAAAERAGLAETPRVPTYLTPLLSQQALSEYSLACQDAQAAAELCAAATSPSPDDLARLRKCRARVLVAEETVSLLPDGAAKREAWNMALDPRTRDLIARLAHATLKRLCGELESPEEKILTTAEAIRGMRTLLEGLRQPAA